MLADAKINLGIMGKSDAAGKKKAVTTNSTSGTSSNRRPTSTTNSTSSTSSNPRPTSSDGTRRIGSFKASFLIDKRDAVVYVSNLLFFLTFRVDATTQENRKLYSLTLRVMSGLRKVSLRDKQ